MELHKKALLMLEEETRLIQEVVTAHENLKKAEEAFKLARDARNKLIAQAHDEAVATEILTKLTGLSRQRLNQIFYDKRYS